MKPCLALASENNKANRQRLRGFSSQGYNRRAIAAVSTCLLAAIPILAIFSIAIPANAVEFAAFRTTDVESAIELRYRQHESINSNAGIVSSSSEQTTYEEEFSVLTHNYIIHPNFVKLDMGAGFTLTQNEYETITGTNQDKDDLYSLTLRAGFLGKKPYPSSIYYLRENPATFSGLEDPLQQTNTRYGFDLALRDPVVPFSMKIYSSYIDNSGSSLQRLVNDTTDTYGFQAWKVYSENYSHRLNFEHNDKFSASGSLALPIAPTLEITDLLNYSSEGFFGEQQQIRYQDHINFTRRQGVVTGDELRFTPYLSWKHSDEVRSTYKYEYLDSSQNSLNTRNQGFIGDLYYQYNKEVKFELEALVEDYQTTVVENKSVGTNARVAYQRPITNGTFNLVTGLDYRENQRNASTTQDNIVGETITLSGLTPVALSREFIISGSIVIQNLARSQTFIENLDYRVIEIGSRSEIQRLGGSSIADPEQVVVDYSYQTGGSVDYSSQTWFYDAGVSFDQFNLYLRHRLNEQKLGSGAPTLPLYSKNTLEYGGAVEYPLSNRVELGAKADMVRERDSNSPHDAQLYDVYSQVILGDSSTLRLSVNKVIIDNLNSIEDSDVTRFSMIYRSRLRNRMLMSAEAYSDKDAGGTVFRKNEDLKFTMQWRVYALTLNAQAVFGREQSGTVENENTRFLLTVRRDI